MKHTPNDLVTTRFTNTRCLAANGDRPVLHIGMLWHAAQPHTVTVMLANTGPHAAPVRWRLDRDMLADSLNAPVGVGDLSLMPDLTRDDGAYIELVLASKGVGRNLAVPLPADRVRGFLADTFQHVPAGAETYDFDMAELGGAAA